MGDEIRIRGCMAVELGVAGLYAAFAERFPEDAEFWLMMSRDELEHEEIFARALALGLLEEGGDDPLVLPTEGLIGRTIDYVNAQRDRLAFTAISREEAFDLALKLEKNLVESYLNEVWELRALNSVREVADKERVHMDKLARYMDKVGLKPYS